MRWHEDGRKVLAAAIIFATLVGAWMMRYEHLGPGVQKNRLTGAMCHPTQSCWFESSEFFRPVP